MELKNKFDFDEKFQNSLINLMLIDREFYYQYSEHIKPAYFTYTYNIIIVKIMLKFFSEFKKIPSYEELYNSVDHFRKREELELYQRQLTVVKESIPTTVEFLKKEVLSFCKRQALMEVLMSAPDYIENGNLDHIKVLVDKATDIGHVRREGYQYFDEQNIKDRLTTNYRQVLPTQIRDLDYVLKGGLAKGEVGLILAPPKRGKSMALINIATAALYQSKMVVYITLEMSERQVANKFDSRVTGIEDVTIATNHKALNNKTSELHKRGCELVIERFPPNVLTPERLRKTLEHIVLKHQREIDLVVVDYMTIMRTSSGENSYDGWVQVASELRTIAIEMDLPLWTAIQTNREGANKDTIEASDISRSFEVVGMVDIMMSLNQTPTESEAGIGRFYVIANRVGQSEMEILITMKKNVCLIHGSEYTA